MRKNLRDYTDYELYQVLDANMMTSLTELAGICSEVLRRRLAQDPKYKYIKPETLQDEE